MGRHRDWRSGRNYGVVSCARGRDAHQGSDRCALRATRCCGVALCRSTRIWRFVWSVPLEEHVAQQQRIYEIENELTAALAQLKPDKKNLFLAFDPDRYPSCREDHHGNTEQRINVFGRDEVRIVPWDQRVFRIYIEKNLNLSWMASASCWNDLSQKRPWLNNVPLHLMHDNPADPHEFKRELMLGIRAHQYLDLFFKTRVVKQRRSSTLFKA